MIRRDRELNVRQQIYMWRNEGEGEKEVNGSE
jgi:hypothetical protein